MAVSARRTGSTEPEVGVARFFRDTLGELRKVVWPTPAELYRYTLVVLVTVVVLGLFIGAVDQGLTELAKRYVYAAVAKGG